MLAALGPHRVSLLRLSDQHEHAGCDPSRDPLSFRCAQRREPDSGVLARIERLLPSIRREALDGNAAAEHAGALLDLATGGGEEDARRALGRLEAIASRAPSAALLNDLAVARALAAGGPEQAIEVLRALNEVEHALALDPDHAAALHNRATLLESIGIVGKAAEAWRVVAAAEGGSAWAEEAARRADALERESQPVDRLSAFEARLAAHAPSPEQADSMVRAAPSAAREWLGERLLDEWADAVLRADSVRARRCFAYALALAAALGAQSGDSTALQAVRRIARGVDAEALARAHRAYAEGRRLYRAGEHARAEAPLRRAAEAFRRADSPYRWWSELWLGPVALYRGDYAGAEAAFRRVRAAAGATSPALGGWAESGLGLTLARQGRYERALSHYRSAEAHFDAAGERDGRGAARVLQMEALSLLGQWRAAATVAYHALSDLRRERGSVQLHNLLVFLAGELSRQGLERAALSVHAENVRTSTLTGRAQDPIDARLSLARALASVERDADARTELERARTDLALIPDSVMRERLRIEIEDAGVDPILDDEPSRARRALDDVVAYFDAHGIAPRLLSALGRRSRAAVLAGDTAAAETDLTRALALLERLTAETRDQATRATLLESALPAFDGMIRLQADRDRPDLALAYLERSRGGRAGGELRLALGDAEALVEYALLPDRLMIWALIRDTLLFHQEVVAEGDLAREVAALEDAVRAGRDTAAWRPYARALHARLIAPVHAALEGVRDVVLIPDRALHRVPFALLADGRTGRLLVEEVALRHLPRADLLGGDADVAVRATSALIVSDPAYDAAAFPDLPSLRAATAEAEGVARLVPRATILRGSEAHTAAFLAQLPGHTLLHFAGHARFRADLPERSHLVLAPGPDGDGGALYPADLRGVDLSRVRLAVLSACSTLGRTDARISGLGGFAATLLAAGVDGVLGSLWEVEDRGTADLLLSFHESLARGLAPAAALREAQLEALRAPDGAAAGVAVWSAFRLEGR